MRASVVIPTFNRRSDLVRVLDALQRSGPSDGVEIVVVDDGSADGTWQWLERWKGPARIAIHQANAGPARARNRGAEAASGELVCFLGDDTVTDVAVLQVLLVLGVRKGDFPSIATEDLDLVRPSVVGMGCGHGQDEHQGADNNGDNNNRADHV